MILFDHRPYKRPRHNSKRHALRWVLLLTTIVFLSSIPASAQLRILKYAPSPADNPLRGLVPYQGDKQDMFPHSLEFNYLSLNQIMKGMDQYDWAPLEKFLNEVAGRRHQAIFRISIEYPGKNGIPQFLIDDGLKVTEWLNTNTAPLPPKKCWTPNYEDQRLRKALKNLISAMGKKYDGDPRVGFITAGLLGTWGEWHTYPRTELFASKEVQTEVQDAFAAAFKTTQILLRSPAGENDYSHAPNHQYPFGYHDDSFAWATLDTGKKADGWYFMPAMRAANATHQWKKHPIGGEIRPELWGEIFDSKPKQPQAQDFGECVRQTHATWLLDTGMFGKKQNPDRIARATEQVQNMCYEFHVSSAAAVREDGQTSVTLTVRNTGVAPFYYNGNIELGNVNRSQIATTWKTDWKLTGLLPGETRLWKTKLKNAPTTGLAVRVVNPLDGGLPLRFANEGQAESKSGWLHIN